MGVAPGFGDDSHVLDRAAVTRLGASAVVEERAARPMDCELRSPACNPGQRRPELKAIDPRRRAGPLRGFPTGRKATSGLPERISRHGSASRSQARRTGPGRRRPCLSGRCPARPCRAPESRSRAVALRPCRLEAVRRDHQAAGILSERRRNPPSRGPWRRDRRALGKGSGGHRIRIRKFGQDPAPPSRGRGGGLCPDRYLRGVPSPVDERACAALSGLAIIPVEADFLRAVRLPAWLGTLSLWAFSPVRRSATSSLTAASTFCGRCARHSGMDRGS